MTVHQHVGQSRKMVRYELSSWSPVSVKRNMLPLRENESPAPVVVSMADAVMSVMNFAVP
jgi:hypothetical protein